MYNRSFQRALICFFESTISGASGVTEESGDSGVTDTDVVDSRVDDLRAGVVLVGIVTSVTSAVVAILDEVASDIAVVVTVDVISAIELSSTCMTTSSPQIPLSTNEVPKYGESIVISVDVSAADLDVELDTELAFFIFAVPK